MLLQPPVKRESDPMQVVGQRIANTGICILSREASVPQGQASTVPMASGRLPQPAHFPVFKKQAIKQANEVLDMAIRRQIAAAKMPPRLVGGFAGLGNLLALRRPTGKIGGPQIQDGAGVNWTSRL